MHRERILTLLDEYKPFDDQEKAMYEETVRFVKRDPDCFDNHNPAGHITASAWIVDFDDKKNRTFTSQIVL